jgi:hypothetical protein
VAENIEILVNPWNDDIGYVQHIFGTPPVYATAGEPHRDPDPVGDVQVLEHAPYPEAHSSAFTHLRLRKYEWDEEFSNAYYISGRRMRWLFAWFDTDEVFARGNVAGFNVCRNRPALDEFSGWTYLAGNGGPDPQGFGRLYRFDPPITLDDCTARWVDERELLVEGATSQKVKSLRFSVTDPTEARKTVDAKIKDGRWSLNLPLTPADARGRIRLYPQIDGAAAVEPAFISVDVPERDRARNFTIAVTCDTPDDVLDKPYTPARLDAEMKCWAEMGVRRMHVIDYSNWPSFWREYKGWQKNYEPTMKALRGNFPAAYAKAIHDHGMEMISDLKTFDISGAWISDIKDRSSRTLPEVDNRTSSVCPEMAQHPEWTMQAHPDLRLGATMPIRALRLYSLESIPNLRRGDVELLTSKDNRKFAPYRKPFKVSVRTISRPHQRWTPTGIVPDKGAARNWVLAIDGLDLREPFAAVRIKGRDVTLTQRGYMVVEALGGAEGSEPQPVTIATNGKIDGGFFCWRGWQGWNNVTENLLTVRKWTGREFGMVFRVAQNMPTLLEPAYEGSRQIWLGRIKHLLDSGSDGVSIRSYNHHNGPMCYLQYAYAKPVLDDFQKQFGRMPENTARDYQAIREIRRDAYTLFMRDARRFTRDRGKKLMFELESGAEVDGRYDCRMQLPIDWEQWISEGLVDEVRLKTLTAHAPFVQERVLPAARKHGVPVSIVSRCLHQGVGMRTVELARQTIGGAAAAGIDGYALYELQNLMDVNSNGRTVLKGPVELYLREAVAELSAQASGCGC